MSRRPLHFVPVPATRPVDERFLRVMARRLVTSGDRPTQTAAWRHFTSPKAPC
jgi:hypothetical protein